MSRGYESRPEEANDDNDDDDDDDDDYDSGKALSDV